MTLEEAAVRIDVLEARLAHVVGIIDVLLEAIREGEAEAAAVALLEALREDLEEE